MTLEPNTNKTLFPLHKVILRATMAPHGNNEGIMDLQRKQYEISATNCLDQ